MEASATRPRREWVERGIYKRMLADGKTVTYETAPRDHNGRQRWKVVKTGRRYGDLAEARAQLARLEDEREARRAAPEPTPQRRGRCLECGRPISRGAVRCFPCSRRNVRSAASERSYIAALRRWAARHDGFAPRKSDWSERADPYREWPRADTVATHFAKLADRRGVAASSGWMYALAQAGLRRPPMRKRGAAPKAKAKPPRIQVPRDAASTLYGDARRMAQLIDRAAENGRLDRRLANSLLDDLYVIEDRLARATRGAA